SKASDSGRSSLARQMVGGFRDACQTPRASPPRTGRGAAKKRFRPLSTRHADETGSAVGSKYHESKLLGRLLGVSNAQRVTTSRGSRRDSEMLEPRPLLRRVPPTHVGDEPIRL